MSTLLRLNVVKCATEQIGVPDALSSANAKIRFINPTSIIDATPTSSNGAVVRYNDPTAAIAIECEVTQAASDL